MKKIFLSYGAIVLVTLISSCGATKAQQSGNALTITIWELSTINGTEATTTDFKNGLPYVSFSADNIITGNGGCNGFRGSYNISQEGDINVSQVMSTKMYCEGVKENEFMQALNKANITKIESDKLTLLQGVDEVMTFKPKNK